MCCEGLKISPFGHATHTKVGINDNYIYEVSRDVIENRLTYSFVKNVQVIPQDRCNEVRIDFEDGYSTTYIFDSETTEKFLSTLIVNLSIDPQVAGKIYLNSSSIWYNHAILGSKSSDFSLVLKEYLLRLQNVSHQSYDYSITVEKILSLVYKTNLKYEDISDKDFILLAQKAKILIQEVIDFVSQRGDGIFDTHSGFVAS